MPFRKRNGERDRSPTAYAAGAPLSAAYSRHFPRPTGEFTPKAHHKKSSTDGTASFMPLCKRNGEPDRSPTAYAAAYKGKRSLTLLRGFFG